MSKCCPLPFSPAKWLAQGRKSLTPPHQKTKINWGAEKLRDDITCLALDLKNTELIKKQKKKVDNKPVDKDN